MARICAPAFAAILAATVAAGAMAAAVGDTYVYRVTNAYNQEVRGNISYRIEKVEADRLEVAVTADRPSLGLARTEVYAKDGNWLRHPVASHDRLRDYQFTTALPVRADSGSWSVRVDAIEPATGEKRSVRVDGEVLGSERITVPAGTFDTVKIARRIYPGDWDWFMRETQIVEIEWYAPVLERPVRSETNSSWQDTSRCSRGSCSWFRGDWDIVELAEFIPARP